VIGLDCNILIQLAFAEHPLYSKTYAAIEAEAKRGTRFALLPLIATEFLHVATDGRRFAPPLTMDEALDWVQEFLVNPMVCLLNPTAESLHQTLRWMRQFNLGRKRILDTHLAAVLHSNGVHRLMTTNPSDFHVFQALEIVTP
jgi:predicted nucleic acid-binding protein